MCEHTRAIHNYAETTGASQDCARQTGIRGEHSSEGLLPAFIPREAVEGGGGQQRLLQHRLCVQVSPLEELPSPRRGCGRERLGGRGWVWWVKLVVVKAAVPC